MKTLTNLKTVQPIAPILLGLALALRLRATFPQVRQSTTLLTQWLRAAVGLQAGARACAMAINAELLAERDLITQCLRNDPPRDRRHIEATLDHIHAQQVALAASLNLPAPAKLLHD